MKRKLAVLFIPAVTLGFWLLRASGEAQTQTGAEHKNIWSGVYTDGEATRGQAIYEQYCVNCHGVSLGGGASSGGPPLAGEKFLENWREDTVENLFMKIRDTMPRRGFQGSEKVLSDREALDIVAYVFKQNSFPSGSELSPTAIGDVWIEMKEGPRSLPNNSQVQIVGCMEQEAGNWVLAKAGQPTRLRQSGEKVEPQVLKVAEMKPPGNLKFRLQNLLMLGNFKPEPHKGHKMLGQGVLIRQSGSERLSVTQLEMVSANCGQ